MNTKSSRYLIYVYIAYAFYILLALLWFFMGYMNSGKANPYALFIVLVFGVQCYYRHLLTNLILGIFTLLGSIFMFLEAVQSAVLASRAGTIMFFDRFLVGMATFSLVMSLVLIFSFMKLGLKDQL